MPDVKLMLIHIITIVVIRQTRCFVLCSDWFFHSHFLHDSHGNCWQVIFFILINIMIITDSSWHFSSRAPSFSKPYPMAEGDEHDQNSVHYENTKNIMITTMSIMANILKWKQWRLLYALWSRWLGCPQKLGKWLEAESAILRSSRYCNKLIISCSKYFEFENFVGSETISNFDQL